MSNLELFVLRINFDAAFGIWLEAVRDGRENDATEALMWRMALQREIAKAEGKAVRA